MTDDQDPRGRVELIDIEQEVKASFLEYAMSVIVSRALPDVRDGLKPVHRRILFSMYDSGIRPGTPFRKSARVVGDVMGWFHPHGGEAIYDAIGYDVTAPTDVLFFDDFERGNTSRWSAAFE